MRVTTEQNIAGQSALKVRNFLRKHYFKGISVRKAETALELSQENAAAFLNELVLLGYINQQWENAHQWFELTLQGEALAHTTAAKPIHRKTAEKALAHFMERVHRVNSTSEYLYRISDVILFGSILSNIERLGDVDIALQLEAKVNDEKVFQDWATARGRVAQAAGRSFRGAIDWICWPQMEIILQLKARSRSLSLHTLEEVRLLPNLSYRVLLGDAKRIEALIPTGRAL
ncbi:hypothetical protein [Granulicella sp. S190]|uniref:hypothetical protein n=1 Tax=Granulicella sp. S190 TaxID=1747226 RepID=UPI00131BB672|nr:hypothetical protein [Granulicella sp. S190]